ncbi:hypothetical protein [Reyranella sp.]|uniref:hypothetical protein n=1 Tax=Reyranella sp. TaxID=1929291 RepID=UPI003D1322C4
MADSGSINDDQPRGRVLELVYRLRELGFTDAADIITNDILLRIRTHVRRTTTQQRGAVPPDESGTGQRFAVGGFEEADVTPLEEDVTPLTDEEQTLLALRAIELAIINPLKMFEEVTSITAEIATGTRGPDDGTDVAVRRIPYIQLGPDRAAIPLADPEIPRLGRDLSGRMTELEIWLRVGHS